MLGHSEKRCHDLPFLSYAFCVVEVRGATPVSGVGRGQPPRPRDVRRYRLGPAGPKMQHSHG
eukprot:11059639-Lingulodinium_polyedra.AAC.1